MREELHVQHVVSDFQFDALICFTVADSNDAQVNGMRGDGGVLGLRVSVCGDESVNLVHVVEQWSQGGRTCEWPRASGEKSAAPPDFMEPPFPAWRSVNSRAQTKGAA